MSNEEAVKFFGFAFEKGYGDAGKPGHIPLPQETGKWFETAGSPTV